MMRQSTFSFNPLAMLRTFIIMVMALVLLTQSTVQAQSTTFATNELKAATAKIKTEIDRRLAATQDAMKALKSVSAVSSTAQSTIATALAQSETALKEFKTQLASVKDLDAAKLLAGKVDGQYDQYANATATAMTLKDTDKQQQTVNFLGGLGKDAQAAIDEGGAAGMDVSGLQEQMKGIKQLIESMGAILASVTALIMSLINGDYDKAWAIFQTILGQLAQNMLSMLTAQESMGEVAEGAKGIMLQLGTVKLGGGEGSKGSFGL